MVIESGIIDTGDSQGCMGKRGVWQENYIMIMCIIWVTVTLKPRLYHYTLYPRLKTALHSLIKIKRHKKFLKKNHFGFTTFVQLNN